MFSRKESNRDSLGDISVAFKKETVLVGEYDRSLYSFFGLDVVAYF